MLQGFDAKRKAGEKSERSDTASFILYSLSEAFLEKT